METLRTRELHIVALAGVPELRPGDDLAHVVIDRVIASGIRVGAGDVFVVAQKVVSKAEGRYVELSSIEPTRRAEQLAAATGKDPRLVEVILRESRRVVRASPGVLIVEHRLGFVMANGGVDHSNIGEAGDERVLCLPADPDASAARLRERLQRELAVPIAVIVNDSFGRAWRMGTVGVALGVAGLPAVVDLRGARDRDGRQLRATVVGYADEIAAAASLVMGQADEGQPVVIVQGLAWSAPATTGRALVRPPDEDLFR